MHQKQVILKEKKNFWDFQAKMITDAHIHRENSKDSKTKVEHAFFFFSCLPGNEFLGPKKE
jgi:hypothetical protein